MSTATEPVPVLKPQAKGQSAGPPDDKRDAPGYLLFHGWKPDGDPYEEYTLWLDPTSPAAEEKKMVTYAKKKMPNGTEVELKRLHVTMPALPVLRKEAVATQRARDRAKK
jgi:hypothetical protein